jgi:hypothetical protein
MRLKAIPVEAKIGSEPLLSNERIRPGRPKSRDIERKERGSRNGTGQTEGIIAPWKSRARGRI